MTFTLLAATCTGTWPRPEIGVVKSTSVHTPDRRIVKSGLLKLKSRLCAAGLRWKRPRFAFAEPAPHVARKKGRSCVPKHLPADGRRLVLDETTLRHLPPLRAAWVLRGQQAEMRICGKNARRSLFGTLDLRTGRRVLLVRSRQRLADYHGFLRRPRHGVRACGALWLSLDRHGSHCRACSHYRRASKMSAR